MQSIGHRAEYGMAHGVPLCKDDGIIFGCTQDERYTSSLGHLLHADKTVLSVIHLNSIGMMPVTDYNRPAAVQRQC